MTQNSEHHCFHVLFLKIGQICLPGLCRTQVVCRHNLSVLMYIASSKLSCMHVTIANRSVLVCITSHPDIVDALSFQKLLLLTVSQSVLISTLPEMQPYAVAGMMQAMLCNACMCV